MSTPHHFAATAPEPDTTPDHRENQRFLNKIDLRGAERERVLQAISEKLTPDVVSMGSVDGFGTREAAFTPLTGGDAAGVSRLVEQLAGNDEALLAAYVGDETTVSYPRLRKELASQTRRGLVHPVFLGSAITGAGVDSVLAGITELLPTAGGDSSGPVSGTVFKIERAASGERIAYARLFSGTVRTRNLLRVGQGRQRKVTAISVFERGKVVPRASLSAGQIGKLRGLGDVQVGDAIGLSRPTPDRSFAPPTLETVVVPRHFCDRGALHVALAQLAEQDPLINVHRDDVRQEVSVSLYGEVQKEVIQATLAGDFGVDVAFRETTTICIERPIGTGAAIEIIGEPTNPFLATVGLRIEPAPSGTGVEFRVAVEPGSMPLAFFTAVEEAVRDTLRQGIYGWAVTDCTVTMTQSGYWARQSHSHGAFDKTMSSTAGDFRHLTPLVVMGALTQAGTMAYEPMHHFCLEVPPDTLGSILAALARLRGIPCPPATRGPVYLLEGEIPAAQVHELTTRLPTLSHGEGLLESAFDRYQPVRGTIPTRPRSDHNPLDRRGYLLRVVRPAAGRRQGA